MMKPILAVLLTGVLIYGCAATAPDSPPNAGAQKNFPSPPNAAADPAEEDRDTAAVLAEEILPHLHKLTHRRLTVGDFTDIDGEASEEGKLLAEQITTRLSRVEGLRLVERRQLNQILGEQKLSLTGITVEEGRKIGQILNVDAIVTGTIADLDDHQEINARLIDAATGEIHCAVSHRRAYSQRAKEVARLPDAQRAALSGEHSQRQARRSRYPEIHRLKENQRQDLVRLKNRNPRQYQQVVRTMQTVERVRRQNAAAFLMLTAPPRSGHPSLMRQMKPQQFKQLKSLRREIDMAIRTTPAYKEMLRYQRKEILKRGFHKDGPR
jgi:TolB-like protein